MTDVASWAATLVDDNLRQQDFALPWGDAVPDLDIAYQVQDAVLDGLSADRGPLGGYKVAITAKPMQEMMGLSEPLGGLVHANDITTSPFTLSMANYHTPALEFEVTARLGTNVPHPEVPYTRDSIARYVEGVFVSFEVIDTRGGEVSKLGAAGLAADRCLCSGLVLGEGLTDWTDLDLAACAVELVWNDEVIETGVTGAAMGHPFEGLAWLANHVAERGRSLEAGHVVLTGSAFTPKPVKAGDTVTYRIEGLGSASVQVTD